MPAEGRGGVDGAYIKLIMLSHQSIMEEVPVDLFHIRN